MRVGRLLVGWPGRIPASCASVSIDPGQPGVAGPADSEHAAQAQAGVASAEQPGTGPRGECQSRARARCLGQENLKLELELQVDSHSEVGRPSPAGSLGTGPELAEAAKRCVAALGLDIVWDTVEAGTAAIEKYKIPLPENVIESISKNKVALKGPITTPVGTGFRLFARLLSPW